MELNPAQFQTRITTARVFAIAGPAMVAVPGYCIDSTEVTIAQYNQFVTAGPDAGT